MPIPKLRFFSSNFTKLLKTHEHSFLCIHSVSVIYFCHLIFIYIYIYIYTVLSVNEYTPFEKYNFKQYLNEHKKHFQNVDKTKTKFNITSV